MKAIIEKKSGFCVFYISEDASVIFTPHLTVSGNSTNNGNFTASFLTEADVEIHSNLPEIEWKPMAMKVENGAWADYSEQIKAANLEQAKASVLARRDEILAECADKTSPEWVAFKEALANVESLPGFPFTHDFPKKPHQ